MRVLKWILLASALSTGSAFAADLAPQPVQPMAPTYLPFSWTGFYVGAQAGYLWGDSTLDGFGGGSASVDPDGAFGGVFAGYNYQFGGGFVVGAEADINFAGAESDNNGLGPLAPLASASTELNWFGSARLRAGYAFDRFLPFVTAGVAFADYSGTSIAPGFSGEIDESRVGWTVGAGLEYAFTDNLIGRIEYRYADYGNESRSGPFAFPGDPVRLDLKTSDIRVGISYKF